jgi:hypothetical protein
MDAGKYVPLVAYIEIEYVIVNAGYRWIKEMQYTRGNKYRVAFAFVRPT